MCLLAIVQIEQVSILTPVKSIAVDCLSYPKLYALFVPDLSWTLLPSALFSLVMIPERMHEIFVDVG